MAILLVLRWNNGVYSLLMNSPKLRLTRRNFLKLCSVGVLSAAIPSFSFSKALANESKIKLGRVAQEGWFVFAEPNQNARRCYNLKFDQIIPILETINQTEEANQGETWYRLADGE